MGQSKGQLGEVHFKRKCNGPNGLSLDLIHIQSLESYQLDDLPAGRNKKESQQSFASSSRTITSWPTREY